MAFDGIVTNAVSRELRKALLSGKIEKIYQPEPSDLLFHIHTKGATHKLLASVNSAHARIHLTEKTPDNPPVPFGFCMLLRKHLQGGRILEVKQKGSERIIEFYVETFNELGFSQGKRLIFEIMGKHSNIILVDESSGKIMDSIKRISPDVNRVRQILPGTPFQYPPPQDKIPFLSITKNEMASLPSDAHAFLDGIQGICPAVSQLLAQSQNPYQTLSSIKTMLEKDNLTPAVYLREDGSPGDFHVIPLELYPSMQKFSTSSQAIDYYFMHTASSNRTRQKASELEKVLSTRLNKLCLKKKRLGEDLLKAKNSEQYRLYGELLTANLHHITPGNSQVTLSNYYDDSQISIPLDPRYSPSKNAQRYFKKYGKAKTAVKEKKIQMEETEQDISYLESVLSYLEKADKAEDVDALRKELMESGYLKNKKPLASSRRKKAKPLEYFTKDGFRVLVGKNNKENDQLTLKTAANKDWWFHTKDIPGSHVILFTAGKEPTKAAIFETASIAAYHSKGRSSENVAVDYTLVRHVKKPTGAKPGMVIFTHNKTVYVTPEVPVSTESSSE